MRIGMKLIGSFVVVALLVAIVGVVGAIGLRNTGRSADVILDEKVPIADASMEGMIALITGRDLMGEFLLAKEVSELDEVEKEFNGALEEFDKNTQFVIKNSQKRVSDLASKADEYHEKFTENALELMKHRRLCLTALDEAGKIMAVFDEHSDELRAMLEQYEEELTRDNKIAARVDAAMEAKYFMMEQKAIAEEYVGLPDLESGKALRKRFEEVTAEFDNLEAFLPESVVKEHDDFVKLAIGPGQMFDTMDNCLKMRDESLEHMVLVDEFSKKGDLTMDEVEEAAAEDMAEAMRVADSAQSFSRTLIIAFTSGAFLIAIVLGLLIGRNISVPLGKSVTMIQELEKGHLGMRLGLNRTDEIGEMAKTLDTFADNLRDELVAILEKLASGDLTFEATPKDVEDIIGNALKRTGEDLNQMVGQIMSATDQIAAGAGQVADASQALSQGATESAAALEQITSSMTELSSQTKTNAENSSQASQLANQARDVAEKGNGQMQDMVSAMDEINEAGQSISKIIKVIDEIAFQTNLLALNAAVEAARAGRHGKGFAVVAEEVRNLAARSAKAAKETSSLIEGSVEKTNKGAEIAGHTAQSLEEIVTAVTQVTDLVGEISAASNEQANGLAQINQGLGQIDQVTQQNTASAEEGAAASEELSSQAVHLKGLMSAFKLRQQTMMNGASSQVQAKLPETPAMEVADTNWGGNKGNEKKLDPSDIIALDDQEFGKF